MACKISKVDDVNSVQDVPLVCGDGTSSSTSAVSLASSAPKLSFGNISGSGITINVNITCS